MQLHPVLQKILSQKYLVLAGWIVMAVIVTAHRIDHHEINNWLLFKYSYFHALHQQNLYLEYPDCCYDSHHYGPFFSLLIAPFALLPGTLGMYAWQVCMAALFFIAIYRLPLSPVKRTLVAVICTQELYVSLREFQTNPAIAAVIILTWVHIGRRREFWAALFIVIGFYVKIYGIVGLAFFFISKDRLTFAKSLSFWAVVFFLAPMVLFKPMYVLQSYADWFRVLTVKNSSNVLITNQFQDVSLMGMIRKVSGDGDLRTLPILLSGLILLGLAWLRTDRFAEARFRMNMLAAVLLFTVLFSTGSELSTYSIAFAGVGIWFAGGEWPKSRWMWAFFLLVLYFGSLFDTDLSTYHLRAQIIKPYALKALPCFLVWLAVIYQLVVAPIGKHAFSLPKLLLNHEG